MTKLKVPLVIRQTREEVVHAVPSKSDGGINHLVSFDLDGKECGCKGAFWFKLRGEDKPCRHQKMTTILLSRGDPMANLEEVLLSARDGKRAWLLCGVICGACSLKTGGTSTA